jgi:hypothetical protein
LSPLNSSPWPLARLRPELLGGALAANEEANRVYHGGPVSLQEIFEGKTIKPTEAATTLSRRIAGRPGSVRLATDAERQRNSCKAAFSLQVKPPVRWPP